MYQIAEGGMFNKPGLTAEESAYAANFWAAMIWLAKVTDYSNV